LCSSCTPQRKRPSGRMVWTSTGRWVRGARVSQVARPRALLGLLGLLGMVAALGGCSRGTPHYNVLLISLDTVRQDMLGCYGHRPRRAPGEAVTPAIDRLA